MVRGESHPRLIDANEVSSDGVKAAVYQNDEILATRDLNRDTPEGSDLFTREVKGSDSFYFYASTGEDERGDGVSWESSFTYEKIKLFEDFKYFSLLFPPESGGTATDDRLAPLYTPEDNLRSNWRSLCDEDVYSALADEGLFVPRRIPLELFRKLYEGTEEKEALLSSYKYDPGKELFYETDGDAMDLVLSLCPRVWTAEERQELFWFSFQGREVYPAEGKVRVNRTKETAPGIFEAPEGTGSIVEGKGFLLDEVYENPVSGDGVSGESEGNDLADESPVYRLWLKKEDGALKVYREQNNTIIPEEGTVSLSNESVEIETNGVKRVYRLTGESSLIPRVALSAYETILDRELMGEESFSASGIMDVPGTLFLEVWNSLSGADRSFLEERYGYADGRYQLKGEVSDEDYHRLLFWFEAITGHDGLFDLVDGQKTVVLLTEEEWTRLAAYQPEIINQFEVFEEGGDLFYGLSRERDEEAVKSAFYEYRRDGELFPYYKEENGFFVLRELMDPGVPEE